MEQQIKNKTLQFKCCLLDSNGSVRDDNDIKLINWDTTSADETPASRANRQMLLDKLRDTFDHVQWPFKTAIRGKLP